MELVYGSDRYGILGQGWQWAGTTSTAGTSTLLSFTRWTGIDPPVPLRCFLFSVSSQCEKGGMKHTLFLTLAMISGERDGGLAEREPESHSTWMEKRGSHLHEIPASERPLALAIIFARLLRPEHRRGDFTRGSVG